MSIDTALHTVSTPLLAELEIFMMRSDYYIYKITLTCYMKRKSPRKGEKSMVPRDGPHYHPLRVLVAKH